jgi:hypothetical protein
MTVREEDESIQLSDDWLLNTGDEVLNLSVESIDRPLPGVESNLKAVFREFSAADVLGKLMEWKRKGARAVTIQLLNAEGKVVEEAVCPRADIANIETSRLNFTLSDVNRFTVTIHGTFGRHRTE